MGGRQDLRGLRFGATMTAIEPTDKRHNSSVMWLCRCDCGYEMLMSTYQINRTTLKSRCPVCSEPEQPGLSGVGGKVSPFAFRPGGGKRKRRKELTPAEIGKNEAYRYARERAARVTMAGIFI